MVCKMFLITAVFLSYVSASDCNITLNDPITGLNPECNNAGICELRSLPGSVYYECECCAPQELDEGNVCGDYWTCDKLNPDFRCYEFSGTYCTEVTTYYLTSLGFRVNTRDSNAEPNIICNTVPYLRATYGFFSNASVLFHEQVMFLANEGGYSPNIKQAVCDTCSVEYPCEIGATPDFVPTTGYGFAFQTHFNEYYDPGCQIDNVVLSPDDLPDCDANYDFGQLAYKTWSDAFGGEIDFVRRLNNLLEAEPSEANQYLGLGWNNSYITAMTEVLSISTDEDFVLTPEPTPAPICGPYINDVNELSFMGVGSDCRGGLNSSWPGGLTCNSPYVVCLPQENTNGTFGDEEYKSTTHRYTVDECLQECANDQRCSGIEFVADTASPVGDCNLIDDIPVVITLKVGTFEYDDSASYNNLDNSTTEGRAICFQKEDYCNPYFEAEQLNDTMLDCYCPNNRKGFYTKKVKRTERNSRFCGNDTEVDTRIRKAQANRMFHLCENWCLFQTEKPEEESWYYDPWKTCWREQYSDGGAHISYCSRVIINPDTIEMQFINRRVQLACNSSQP